MKAATRNRRIEMLTTCPKCGTNKNITVTFGGHVVLSCVGCGQGWRSLARKVLTKKGGLKKSVEGFDVEFSGVTGAMTVRAGNRVVRLAAIS